MKYFLSSIILIFIFSFNSYGQEGCDSVPKLNQKIVKFVKSKMKKKVGRGECWDLAAEPLDKNKAKWNGGYEYGKLVNPSSDCIYPGDIIQFEGVVIEYKYNVPNGMIIEEMPHHTAVVYKVNGKGDYIIAHQNYGKGKRKVGTTKLRLKDITKGSYFIYRPQE